MSLLDERTERRDARAGADQDNRRRRRRRRRRKAEPKRAAADVRTHSVTGLQRGEPRRAEARALYLRRAQ
jgi:hypothetical protein